MLFRFATAFCFCAVVSHAQTNTFEVTLGGKPIGRDVYTLAKAGNAYKLKSRYKVKFKAQGQPGQDAVTVDLDFTDDFKYDQAFFYMDGSVENMDTSLRTSYIPNKPRNEMLVARSFGGNQDSNVQQVGPNLVVLNSMDAGTAQVALQYLASHPLTLVSYSLYIPGQSGSGGRRDAKTSSPMDEPKVTLESNWSKGDDAAGSLAGKPLVVHTYTLSTDKTKWTFYADDAGTLLELSASSKPAVSTIRDGFKLETSPRVTAGAKINK